MDIEALASSKIGKIIVKVAGTMMESRIRYKVFSSMKFVQSANIQSGQTVFEVGGGTGFYTISIAQVIGVQGCLVTMEVLSEYVKLITKKVQDAKLKNVQVVKRDAMNTGLDAESFDAILLFSVIPSPTLPLKWFLPEMHRILKPEGFLAVTTFSWVHRSIRQSGLFKFTNKQSFVHNYKRCNCE